MSSNTYEIEATFVARDDTETPAWVEQRLRSLGCTDVLVTVVCEEVSDDAE